MLISVCSAHYVNATFSKIRPTFLSFQWFQNITAHTYYIVLHNQSVPKASTIIFSRCKSHDQKSSSLLRHLGMLRSELTGDCLPMTDIRVIPWQIFSICNEAMCDPCVIHTCCLRGCPLNSDRNMTRKTNDANISLPLKSERWKPKKLNIILEIEKKDYIHFL